MTCPIHEVFRARAKENPDQTALVYRSGRMSYAELDALSDRFAVELQRHGVGPGDRVPVLLTRSPVLVAVLLAVLKTGAAYAVLDGGWPAGRIDALIRRLAARLVVAPDRDAVPAGFPVWTPPTTPGPAALEPVAVSGADACCVFFTSGSTGAPKGALVPHAGTVRLFVDCPFAELGPETVMPQAAPLPWDGLTLELWAPLLNGGTAVLVDEPFLTPPLLRELVARLGVNTIWLTASVFNMAIDEDPGFFTGLRQVLVGGERLSVKHVAAFLAAHPRIRLVNGYGPAECTVFVTTHRIRPEDLADPDGVPVGRPVPRTEILVLDGDRGCAPGELGEICVAGAGLALEYIGDPASTAAKFVTLPRGPVRVYRTGDLGRLSADGLLYVLGRIDRQVKIQGKRVEPAEIEHAIMAVSGVIRAVVEPVRDALGAGIGLAGFYSAGPGLTPRRLRAALREALPAYLVPTELYQVTDFPYTANGKIDHAALLARERRRPEVVASPDAAVGEGVRAHVVAVFAELLGIGDVPDDTSFFAMGGGSLDAGRACVRLGERLGRIVQLSTLMRAPTVAGLSGALSAGAGRGAEPVDGHRIPLTPWQEAFWTADGLRSQDVSGHCQMLWWLTGNLDVAALTATVADLHHRHESLRARYVLDAEPVAVVDGPAEPELHELTDGVAPSMVEAAVLAVLDRPLDLSAGRVWRAVVQRCAADGRWLLGLVVHHIAFDGRSEALLSAELSHAYRARLAGRAPGFAAPAPGLAETSLQIPAVELGAQKSFWRATMAHLRPLALPIETVPVTGRDRMAVCGFSVDASTWAGLTAAARAQESTAVVPALVAWAQTLREATGQSDFCIGLPVDKRVTRAMTTAVGCFVGMCCVPAAGLLGDDLARAGGAVRDVLAAQDIPLAGVVRLARGGPGPPYQTILALQQHDPPELRLPGCLAAHSRPTAPEPLCDVLVELWPTGGSRVDVLFTSDASRIPDWFAAMLADTFRTKLYRLARPGGVR